MSSVMASGESSLASASPVSPRVATTALKPLLARHAQHDAGELQVVLDDEEDPVALAQVLAVVLDGRCEPPSDRDRRGDHRAA